MTKSGWWRSGSKRGVVCWVACVLVCAAASGVARGVTHQQQGQRLDINLRSFTPRARGRLTIEPDASGGRGRVTALNLPDPQTLSQAARTYVVWAGNEGRFIRLGELRRDVRGNGGLAFAHPAEFARYTLLITAETSADTERPAGAPVLSTRAGEAQAVYGAADVAGAPASANDDNGQRPPDADAGRGRFANRATRSRSSNGGADFYAEVDDVLDAQGGGRALLLEGESIAPRARGDARVTAQTGNGYVRVRFRGLPLPSNVGADTYVMWAIVPDGSIVYMGSLPATKEINYADIYVRVAGFNADDFELFVTSEMRHPVFVPSDKRALSTRKIRSTVK